MQCFVGRAVMNDAGRVDALAPVERANYKPSREFAELAERADFPKPQQRSWFEFSFSTGEVRQV